MLISIVAEFALTRLQFAELLLEHYPDGQKEAMDFTIKEFREMKMQPPLERALSHNDILKTWLAPNILYNRYFDSSKSGKSGYSILANTPESSVLKPRLFTKVSTV